VASPLQFLFEEEQDNNPVTAPTPKTSQEVLGSLFDAAPQGEAPADIESPIDATGGKTSQEVLGSLFDEPQTEVSKRDPDISETWEEMRSREIKTYAPSMLQHESSDLPILRNLRDATVAYNRNLDEGLKSIKEGGFLNTLGGVVQFLFAPFSAASESLLGNPAGEVATQIGASKNAAVMTRDIASATGEVFAPVGAVKSVATKGLKEVQKAVNVMTKEEAILGEAKAYRMGVAAGADKVKEKTVAHALGAAADKITDTAEKVAKSNALTDYVWETGKALKANRAYKKQKQTGMSAGEGVMRVTAGRSITTLRNMAKKYNSKFADDLADMMESAQDAKNGRVLSQWDYHERVSRETGRLMSEYNSALSKFKDKKWFTAFRGGEISKSARQYIGQAMRGTASGTRLEAERAVAGLRDVFEKSRTYYNRAVDDVLGHLPRSKRQDFYLKPLMRTGLDGKRYRVDYYPRMYDKSAKGLGTEKGRAEFEDLVQTAFNEANPNLADKYWDYGRRVTDAIMSGELKFADDIKEFSHLNRVGGVEFGSRLKRTLDFIPDEKLEKFLITDPVEVIPQYLQSIVKRAEWIRTFGVNGEKLERHLNGIIKDAKKIGKPVEAWEIEDVRNIARGMQHNYNPIASTFWKAMNNGIHTYQYLRTLALAPLSSLSEAFVPMLRAPAGSALHGALRSYGSMFNGLMRGAFKGVPEMEARRAAEEIFMGMDKGIAEFLAQRSSGTSNKVLETFFRATGLTGVTRGTMVGAFHVGQNMVKGHAEFLSKFKPDEVLAKVKAMRSGREVSLRGYTAKATDNDKLGTFISELNELGIDPMKAYTWARTGGERGGRGLSQEDFNMAGIRFVKNVVMQPRATVKPLWHSNPRLKLLSQLKGFVTTFSNTVIKKLGMELIKGGYRSRSQATRVATGATAMITTAFLSNEFREWFKYDRTGGHNPFDGEDGYETFMRAFDRSGLGGITQIGMDLFKAHRFGRAASGQFTPGTSQLDELAAAVGEGLEDNERRNRMAAFTANAIPVVNTIPEARDWVKGWFDE